VIGGFTPGTTARGAYVCRGRSAHPAFALLLAIVFLQHGVPAQATDAAPEKRVEQRNGPAETTTRPAGATPGSASSGGVPEKCPPTPPSAPEQITVVEEVRVTEVLQPVVIEVPVLQVEAAPEAAGHWVVEEILQSTRGRPRVTSTAACTDPRYPLPSYGLVGIAPPITWQSARDTVRLQRFECEIEVDAAWQPADTLFTLVVGLAQFQFTVLGTDRPENRVVHAVGGRGTFLLSATVLRGISSFPGQQRCVVSLVFPEAAAGRAPRLDPGEGVYLSADPSAAAPPGQGVPKFILVKRSPEAVSNLVLIEKSGTSIGLLPAVSDLELAATCAVVHLIPR
jgi:hypothetical protein